MKGDPKIVEMINGIAYKNFQLGVFFHKFQKIMNCPECGSCLVIGNVEIYETLSEHVTCDESYPRITFRCKNESCKTYKKGYWGC